MTSAIVSTSGKVGKGAEVPRRGREGDFRVGDLAQGRHRRPFPGSRLRLGQVGNRNSRDDADHQDDEDEFEQGESALASDRGLLVPARRYADRRLLPDRRPT